MNIVKIKDLQVVQYPYTFDNLKKDNPYTNYDLTQDIIQLFSTTEQAIAGFELVNVVYENEPVFDQRTQKIIYSDIPVYIDNVWTLQATIVDKTTDELSLETSLKANQIRTERNTKLKDTDWLVIKAYETSSSLNPLYTEYRQSLRDITTQSGFPWEVSWPEDLFLVD